MAAHSVSSTFKAALPSAFHSSLDSLTRAARFQTPLCPSRKGGREQKKGKCCDQCPSNIAASSFFGETLRLKSFRTRAKPVRSGQTIRMVTTESGTMEVGGRAPDFALPEPLSGKTVALDDFDGAPALLVIFMCNHCPYVIHLKDAVKELTDEYMRKGLSVVAISSNSVRTHPQDGPQEMAAFAKQNGYEFPYLYDESQEVAKAYGAVCTPELYVFKKDGRRPFELAYHGRFDETRPRSGQKPTGKDLRNALDCALSGRPVSGPQRPSIGCSIKWHPEE